jgi:glycosyltransferase involved in cell wall biosynthesis
MNRVPVVFIEQVPWGGGAEKVVYSLATRLDQTKFAPYIVYLYNLPEQAMPFESIVPLICAQTDPPPIFNSEGTTQVHFAAELPDTTLPTEIPVQTLSGLLPWLHRLYRRMNPELRARLRLGEVVQKICRQFQSRTPFEEALSKRNDMGRLNAILSAFPESAVFVAVMEEASIYLWLNQAHQQRRWVAWLHTVESQLLPRIYLQEERLIIEKWLLANASSNAKLVVFPSQGCKEDMSEHFGIPGKHIRVISNPLDVEAIVQQSLETPVIEPPQRRTLFVQVGRLQQEKNHRLLVEGCRLLRLQEEDFAVICLGKGQLRAEIQALVDEYDLSEHVFLLGAVANPYPYMAAARAVTLTSDFESFALVLAEAMACGAVPISVDCPVGPRDVLHDGKYGLLVPPNDPQALANTMLKISRDDDLHSHLKAIGLERSRQYNIDPITQQWETLLKEIVTKNGGNDYMSTWTDRN